eukprot:CAMPEP_0114413850 /NCGR_PEP_ID=MMETSP0103-20121206/1074_1 /TAXON_ID=37642 ORGANISM="Paraphysomonas imperforata, Strain PA2" /NCGR_SAMPLE_ID=MMETSP0103 /ASSEMBLY_ACC=CAM_ASM_000201 /LENGTH=1218 /DNA_ID=CAMNT_0001581951 /DNA_START=181 /DNA_END=3837 /DNA_ORIENTATION=-
MASTTSALDVEEESNNRDEAPVVTMEPREEATATHQTVADEKEKDRNEASVEAVTGVFARLSKEQLVEYTKKQKKEIKKLKTELAERQRQELAPSSDISLDLFWATVERRPEWQQRLAKVSLTAMFTHVAVFRRLANAKLHSAFYKWSAMVGRSCLSDASCALEENKMTNAHLEQRVVKLKGLLAKVHHSHQKNAQDTQSARQGHRAAAEELRERVQQQQSQTQHLQEQLRYMSFESAFQTDMEAAIEKAAMQLTSRQQTAADVHHVDNIQLAARVSELEGEQNALLAGKTQLTEEITALRDQLDGLQHDNAIKTKELQLQRRRDAEVRAENVLLQKCIREQDVVQRELELEVRALVAGGADVAARVDAAASEKATQDVKVLQLSLEEEHASLARAEQRAVEAEKRIERLERDLSAMRMKSNDALKIRAENDRLTLLVRELKRSSTGSKTVPVPQAIATAAATAACVSLEKRVLGYLLHPLDDDMMAELFSRATEGKRSQATSEYYQARCSLLSCVVKSVCHGVGCTNGSTHTMASTMIAELFRDLDASLGLNWAGQHEISAESSDPLIKTVVETIGFTSSSAASDVMGGDAQGKFSKSLLARYHASSLKMKELEVEAALSSNHIESLPPVTTPRTHTLREETIFKWNASAITVLAGRDISLPVPIPRELQVEVYCLRWQIRGSQLDSLQLTLSPLGEGVTESTAHLDSTLSLDASTTTLEGCSDEEFVLHGEYLMKGGQDQMLRIANRASWVTASFSYAVQLCAHVSQEEDGSHLDSSSSAMQKGDIADELSNLSALLSHQREELEEGLRLRSVFTSHVQAWQAASASFEALYRSCVTDDGEVLRAISSSDIAGQDALDCITQQYSRFRCNIEVVERHFCQRPPPGATTLISLLDLPPDLPLDKVTERQDQRQMKEGTTSPSTIISQPGEHREDRTMFSAAELLIRPSRDFRCPLLTPLRPDVEGYYLISWDFDLLPQHPPGTAASHRMQRSSEKYLDIGFCVLAKKYDGSLPQLMPYRRVTCGGGEGVAGSLRYRVSDDESKHTELGKDKNGLGEVCAPFQDVVVLFDNSYSWFTPKLLRYEVSVEFVLEQRLSNRLSTDHPTVTEKLLVAEDVVRSHDNDSSDCHSGGPVACTSQDNVDSLISDMAELGVQVRSSSQGSSDAGQQPFPVSQHQQEQTHNVEHAMLTMEAAAQQVLETAGKVREFCRLISQTATAI